jgi:hypothetical protein
MRIDALSATSSIGRRLKHQSPEFKEEFGLPAAVVGATERNCREI